MIEAITEDKICIDLECNDWEDCIRKCAQPLLDNESININYIDSIIETCKEVGPYIVISKSIALSHSRPENGVYKNDLAIAKLKKPIYFGSKENDPVRIVITLAALDNEAHLELLSVLSDILSDNNVVNSLIASKTKSEFISIIENSI